MSNFFKSLTIINTWVKLLILWKIFECLNKPENATLEALWSPVLSRNNRAKKRERNVLFNDALNTFYLRLYGVRHMVKTILIVRKETRCSHIGYSYRLAARVLLYAPSHRQDNTYHGLCYTSRGALAGTRNSSMGPPHEGSIRRPIAPWANALPLSQVPLPGQKGCAVGSEM